MRSDRLRLLDVLDAIDVLARYAPADRRTFDADEPLQSHLFRHVMIVGEALWKLSPALKATRPDLPWRKIEGMRHLLVHDYFRVDWDIVYQVARSDAPALRPAVEAMLASLPPEG